MLLGVPPDIKVRHFSVRSRNGQLSRSLSNPAVVHSLSDLTRGMGTKGPNTLHASSKLAADEAKDSSSGLAAEAASRQIARTMLIKQQAVCSREIIDIAEGASN
jgi:hypothetical protein